MTLFYSLIGIDISNLNTEDDQITRSTQTSPSLHKTTDCEISEEHSSIDSIDQLHANSKHWTTSEPQTNSEQSVPQTHSETSAIPVPQTYSEASKMPEPQTNSESSTIPVPQTNSDGTVESNDVIIQPGCNDSKYIGNSILGYYVGYWYKLRSTGIFLLLNFTWKYSDMLHELKV